RENQPPSPRPLRRPSRSTHPSKPPVDDCGSETLSLRDPTGPPSSRRADARSPERGGPSPRGPPRSRRRRRRLDKSLVRPTGRSLRLVAGEPPANALAPAAEPHAHGDRRHPDDLADLSH